MNLNPNINQNNTKNNVNDNYYLKLFKWAIFTLVFCITSSVYAIDYYFKNNLYSNYFGNTGVKVNNSKEGNPEEQDNKTQKGNEKIEDGNQNKDLSLRDKTLAYIDKKENKQDILNKYNKIILVNLKDKTLTLKNNNDVAEYNIATIGPKGSFYETPSGEYEIRTKEKVHYSSLGHVYMPYSMQFFGNFFIHGIPYYEDGREVSSTYSGGCIRVNTDIMKKIYDASQIGDKIIIVGESFLDTNNSDVINNSSNILNKDEDNNISDNANTRNYSLEEKYKDIIYISKNIDNVKADNIFMSLIALEIANVNNTTVLETGETKQILKMLPEIINNNNTIYKNTILKKMYYTESIKKQRLDSISKMFNLGENTDLKYNKTMWDNEENKIILIEYIKNHKSYLYKIIENNI